MKLLLSLGALAAVITPITAIVACTTDKLKTPTVKPRATITSEPTATPGSTITSEPTATPGSTITSEPKVTATQTAAAQKTLAAAVAAADVALKLPTRTLATLIKTQTTLVAAINVATKLSADVKAANIELDAIKAVTTLLSTVKDSSKLTVDQKTKFIADIIAAKTKSDLAKINSALTPLLNFKDVTGTGTFVPTIPGRIPGVTNAMTGFLDYRGRLHQEWQKELEKPTTIIESAQDYSPTPSSLPSSLSAGSTIGLPAVKVTFADPTSIPWEKEHPKVKIIVFFMSGTEVLITFQEDGKLDTIPFDGSGAMNSQAKIGITLMLKQIARYVHTIKLSA